MMCSGASDRVMLTVGGKVFRELLISEDAIVRAVFLDSVLVPLAKLFVSLFAK